MKSLACSILFLSACGAEFMPEEAPEESSDGECMSALCGPDQQIGTEIALGGVPGAGARADIQSLVTWAAVDKQPRVVGVTLGIELSPTDVTGGAIQATGIVDWGVLGAKFQAEIDIVNGTTFAVFADYINIQIRNDSGVGAVDGFRVRAAIGLGSDLSRSDGVPPTRTVLTANLAAGATIITIPRFAKAVDFIRNNFAASSFRIEFQDTTNIGTLGQVDVAVGTQLTRPLQIPQGARAMRLTDLAGTARILSQFQLCL